MLGIITEKVHSFAKDFSFEHFYCSYIPENQNIITDMSRSMVEVKFSLEDFVESNLQNALVERLLGIFDEIQEETPKKKERMVKEYQAKVKKSKEYDNLGMMDKITTQIGQKKNK